MFTRKLILPTALALSLAACAGPRGQGPSPKHGFDTMGVGIGNLILSPLQIAAGLLEGLATLPYFVAMDLHALNRSMVQSHSAVDVGRTYHYAHGRPLASINADTATNQAARHMSVATHQFQQVLRGYGVADYEHYILTAVRSADRDGYTLYAVVNRPSAVIRVPHRSAGGELRLSAEGREYYRPYEHDALGNPLDVIVDWAGIPRSSIRTRKGQAILMTIAANSVLTNRRSDDYWATEKRWRSGQFRHIVAERKAYLDKRMGRSS